jgi:hypothetical protein
MSGSSRSIARIATDAEAMSGTIMSYSRVNSNSRITAVMGARNTAASTADAPICAHGHVTSLRGSHVHLYLISICARINSPTSRGWRRRIAAAQVLSTPQRCIKRSAITPSRTVGLISSPARTQDSFQTCKASNCWETNHGIRRGTCKRYAGGGADDLRAKNLDCQRHVHCSASELLLSAIHRLLNSDKLQNFPECGIHKIPPLYYPHTK